MNISESYDVKNLMTEVKHIIEVERYRKVARKNDSKIVEWENSQVKLIRKNEWTDSKYVILVTYGEFSDNNEISVGNRTAPFDFVRFNETSARLNQSHFPA
jgi:hypothetical protein